jgi:hypothetical protein
MAWKGKEKTCHGKARHGLVRQGKARSRSRSLIYLVSDLSKSLMVIY